MNEREMTLAAIFNVFTSWSWVDHFEGGTLGELMSKAGSAADSGEYAVRQAYEILSDAMERYPELSDTKILGPSWMQGGRFNSETVACAFELPSGEIFVSYCGTGDGGWIDNGQGVTQASTQQQREAAGYFDYLAERYGWTEDDHIIVTGHSKGGNKSQYTTLMAENNELIDTCYSMDGQGFSDAAIEMFKEKYGEEGYQEILDKMYAVNGYNDYVSPLINPVITPDHTTYLKTTENPDGGLGGEYAGFHMVNMYFRYEDGEFVSLLVPETDERGDMGDLAARLSEYLMSLPEDQKDAAAMVIMQILEGTEGTAVGIDGDTVSVDDLLSFGSETLIPVIMNVIGTKEGWAVLRDLVDRISDETDIHPALIAAVGIILAPFAITLAFTVAECTQMLRKIEAMLEMLGEAFRKAVEAFRSFIEFISDVADSFIEWVKSWGRSADHSYFKADTSRMRRLQSDLTRQQSELERAAGRVRNIRRNVDFGLLTKQALYFRLSGIARNLESRANEVGRMETALGSCADRYDRSERKITARYQRA